MYELDLADLARARHAYAEAEGRFTRALARLGAGDPKRLLAVRGMAWVRARTGRVTEALADFDAALEMARAQGNREAEIELLLEKATALDWNNDVAGAARCAEEASALEAQGAGGSRVLQASLLAAHGRTLFRQGRWSESAAVLEKAVAAAEALGANGYEPLVISLVLLEVVLPQLGREQDAYDAASRAVALTRAQGDQLNLASALNNRRNLLVARNDLDAAVADQRAFMEIGKQLGLEIAEYFAEFNLAELHYQAGDVSAAMSHARRAAAFETAGRPIAPRPSAALLQARILLFQNLLDEARTQLKQLQDSVRAAQANRREAAQLTPSEEILAAAIDLGTREASSEEWDALVARSSSDSLEQEPIEVLEMRARHAHRHGRREDAQRSFTQALELSAKIPNLLAPRIRAAIASA